jgi:inhibitor of KinA
MHASFSIIPLNEAALIVRIGNVISEAVNKQVIALHQQITINPFIGFIEALPAYAELTIFYDIQKVRTAYPTYSTAFDAVKALIENIEIDDIIIKYNRKITIPVLYNGADLEFIAAQKNISIQEIIKQHTATVYRVYMIGFLPGFAYMGTVNNKIAVPRKVTPRTQVPPGSVGIAGRQTGIYPSTSPGGWQLIGQTPLKIFNKENSNPCLLSAGDEVQFVSIQQDEFKKINEY